MSIPPESIQVGRCYLAKGEKALQVRRVVRVLPDGRVQFERRDGIAGSKLRWVLGLTGGRAFATAIVRQVPCDWTPESAEDGA